MLGTAVGLFFLVFLFYPLAYVALTSLHGPQGFGLENYYVLLSTPGLVDLFLNSINLGLACLLCTSIIALPLAVLTSRYDFQGKNLVRILLFLPLVLPPFVSALGMRKLLARFGPINLGLLNAGIISEPFDFLGESGFWGIALTQALHLFPLLHLNLEAALNTISPQAERAAENLGATRLQRFRRITLPLLQPAYLAGATVVFLASVSDLGTPLIFQYRPVLPVHLFGLLDELQANPLAHCLITLMALLALGLFSCSQLLLTSPLVKSEIQQAHRGLKIPLGPRGQVLTYVLLSVLLLLSLLPHLGITLTAFSKRWVMTSIPEGITLEHLGNAVSHPLFLLGLKNSLLLATGCTLLALLLALYVTVYGRSHRNLWSKLLQFSSLTPLAIPGLALALSYLVCFSSWPFRGTWFDPRQSALLVLTCGYALRRLPLMVQSIQAGFSLLPPGMEQAATNLGAQPSTVLRRIVVPLLMPFILASCILCFAFSLLEVSESLLLALREESYPLTKSLYTLLARPDGASIGSAVGFLAMILLGSALAFARKLEQKHAATRADSAQ